MFINASFVRFESIEKFAKAIWKDFLERNDINSSALLGYLGILFENDLLEFLYFKMYIECTFKRGFEYPLDLKITSNKVCKLVNSLEVIAISQCLVRNRTVASILGSILKRKKMKTQLNWAKKLTK